MFTDESHNISCLINKYNHKVSFKLKVVLLTLCSLKIDFTDLHVIFFKGINILIYWWHNMTFPFWKMVLVDAFVLWYSQNELINTSLHFFLSFLKINLFWLSKLLAFKYELTKSLTNKTQLPCYNITIMIIHKGVIIFITATFNWIRVFKEFINI